MIKEIIHKIDKDKEVDVRYFLNKFKMSHVLFEYILKGMEKKRYLKSIECNNCEFSEICSKNNKKYCKGYGKYWILTNKVMKERKNIN